MAQNADGEWEYTNRRHATTPCYGIIASKENPFIVSFSQGKNVEHVVEITEPIIWDATKWTTSHKYAYLEYDPKTKKVTPKLHTHAPQYRYRNRYDPSPVCSAGWSSQGNHNGSYTVALQYDDPDMPQFYSANNPTNFYWTTHYSGQWYPASVWMQDIDERFRLGMVETYIGGSNVAATTTLTKTGEFNLESVMSGDSPKRGKPVQFNFNWPPKGEAQQILPAGRYNYHRFQFPNEMGYRISDDVDWETYQVSGANIVGGKIWWGDNWVDADRTRHSNKLSVNSNHHATRTPEQAFIDDQGTYWQHTAGFPAWLVMEPLNKDQRARYLNIYAGTTAANQWQGVSIRIAYGYADGTVSDWKALDGTDDMTNSTWTLGHFNNRIALPDYQLPEDCEWYTLAVRREGDDSRLYCYNVNFDITQPCFDIDKMKWAFGDDIPEDSVAPCRLYVGEMVGAMRFTDEVDSELPALSSVQIGNANRGVITNYAIQGKASSDRKVFSPNSDAASLAAPCTFSHCIHEGANVNALVDYGPGSTDYIATADLHKTRREGVGVGLQTTVNATTCVARYLHNYRLYAQLIAVTAATADTRWGYGYFTAQRAW